MKRSARAYTLAELLVALGILAIFLTLFLSVVSASFRTVRTVQSRTDAQQKARIAMNYIRDRLAQASSFTPGVELYDFYRYRPNTFIQSPFLTLCDLNSYPNWATGGSTPPAPDNTIDLFDTAKFTRVPPSNIAIAHSMEDPLCLADPVPPVQITLPGGTQMNINENPDQNYPSSFRGPQANLTRLYRTELEDLDGNGAFTGIENYLRTLVFEVRSPSAALWGPSTCLAGASGNRNAKVDREIVTLAHTWKEKKFWQDDNRDGAVQAQELRTEDFVLYERKTRYFEDPTRNADVNCDGTVNDADEVARVAEVPLVSGIIDVFYQLLDDRGEQIMPCTGNCTPPSGLNELSGRRYTGEFMCYLSREYFDPGLGQRQTNSDNIGVPFSGAPGWGACRNIDRIRVTVVTGSDEAIRLIRKSMDANFIPFKVFDTADPKELGALDYLGVFSDLYQKGSLVILQEEVSLNLLGG